MVTAPPSPRYPRGDHQVSGRRLLGVLKRVLRRLGLPGHLHTFRHAFISTALTQGIPEALVREWVGHVDPDIMKLYTHIASQASQAAMKRFVGEAAGEGGWSTGKSVAIKDGSRFQYKFSTLKETCSMDRSQSECGRRVTPAASWTSGEGGISNPRYEFPRITV